MKFQSLKDLTFIQPADQDIGEGGFSSVKLVKHNEDGRFYALKTVKNLYKI